jgi:hypothetical protein
VTTGCILGVPRCTEAFASVDAGFEAGGEGTGCGDGGLTLGGVGMGRVATWLVFVVEVMCEEAGAGFVNKANPSTPAPIAKVIPALSACRAKSCLLVCRAILF